MTVKMNITGLLRVNAFLKKKNNDVSSAQVEGLKNAAIFVQGEVKESIAGQKAEPTSVDTGRFLNSVDFNSGKNEATVFSELSYAGFLEFGTSRLQPRKHFRNSLNRNKENVKRIIQGEVNSQV